MVGLYRWKYLRQKPSISLKYILLYAFLLLFILPVIFINVVSYYNNIHMVKNTMQKTVNQNLMQTQKNLHVILSSYEYMLYQIYTDPKMIDLVGRINENEDAGQNSLVLTQMLGNAIYGQSYVRAISVITDSGRFLYYDRLKGSRLQDSWIQDSTIAMSNIYKQTMQSKQSYIFSTQSGKDFSGQIYYYCHIAHPFVDYKDYRHPKGIVILSIDVDVLNKNSNANITLEPGSDNQSFCFLLDQNNNIISFPRSEFIGKNILSTNNEDIRDACRDFILRNGIMRDGDIDIQTLNDGASGWKVVQVSDNAPVMRYIHEQYQITAITIICVTILLGLLIFFLNKKIFNSLNDLICNMKLSKNDKFVLNDHRTFIKEIDMIYQNFAQMLRYINMLIVRIKHIMQQQRNSEIKSLEAQINPHFLYNSLDMINWMAIDAGEYQISDAVHSLAQILRYSITTINIPVTIGEETAWVERYLHLQQMRLKGDFCYEVKVASAVRECMIYKMIMQPFIENAILHGFRDTTEGHMIWIGIFRMDEGVGISIRDNGRGISPGPLQKIRNMLSGGQGQENVDRHIGLYNVCTRLQLYYGSTAHITVQSKTGQGTEFLLQIPFVGREQIENCGG